MLLNRENLLGIQREIKTTFNRALEQAQPQWDKVAMLVTSSTRQNDYAWLGEFPSMVKWIGDKTVKQLRAHAFVIVNENFEATIAVKRDDIEDDNLGIYAPQAQMAGESAAFWPDELVYPLLNAAFTTGLAYDGQPFFDTEHPVGEGDGVTLYSNKLTAPLSISTQAAAMASLGAARTLMRRVKNDAGRPLNLRPTTLLVPPALEDIARALVSVDRLEDGKPNLYKGAATVEVSPLLTSDTAWFLLDNSRALRPLIFQRRKAPVFVSQTSLDSDDVFNRAEFKFGAEARGNAGYGLWQLAVGSTGAGS